MKIKKRLAQAFVGIWAFGMSSTACALPVLDTKDAAVRINTSGQVMNINSSAVNNVVKWVDFSIAGGETVAFDKNNYLNYVTGHAASEIFGTLTGGGNIFIINPHGILIGHDANVNVGNLYLSTQILSDAQLDAFRACGTSPILDASNAKGNVVNLGHLEAKTVVVEGNVIKFKNVAEVDAPTINFFAKTETRVGCEGETLPDGWRFFRAGTEGQVAPLKFKLINDEADLQKIMVNDANGRYMLAGNIKVNNDFTAIGTSSQDQGRFLGHFDGLGYEITFTKKIKANGKTSGLFGAIGEGSVVENVGVITSALEFSSTGSFNDVFVGGVVGDNRKGTIQNVWHSGNIHVDYSCNYLYVGGIVGCNTAGTIMSAYNTGKVFASGAEAPGVAYVGGIAGYQQNEDGAAKPLVENAFNSGMVTAEGSAVVGGIAGAIRGGNIHNVYNLGSVSARTAGGIVGRNDRPGIVSCAYHAAGSISGITKGAIVGVTNDKTGTFENVLFAETDAEDHSLSDTKGTPKSETGLKKLETFEQDGWSISSKGGAKTVWRICDGYSMPLLTAFLKTKYNSSIVKYDGTRPVGTYRSEPSVSTQLEGFQQGCDYISDLLWVLPKDEPTGTKPIDTNHPADDPKPIKPIGLDTVATEDSIDKEYENEIAALQHLETEDHELAGAAMESETDKLIVVGSGVRLPDAMSSENLETMLSEARIQGKT